MASVTSSTVQLGLARAMLGLDAVLLRLAPPPITPHLLLLLLLHRRGLGLKPRPIGWYESIVALRDARQS
jgi:hypothetical protein